MLGMGSVRLSVVGGEFVLTEVHYVPGLTCPLVSVARPEDSGYSTVLSRESHYVADEQGRVVLEVERHHRPGSSGGQ